MTHGNTSSLDPQPASNVEAYFSRLDATKALSRLCDETADLHRRAARKAISEPAVRMLTQLATERDRMAQALVWNTLHASHDEATELADPLEALSPDCEELKATVEAESTLLESIERIIRQTAGDPLQLTLQRLHRALSSNINRLRAAMTPCTGMSIYTQSRTARSA
jgi:hypothetical protein